MTQVRSILPDRLKRARFTTIAKDPSYRRYFAAGDDSASIRTVLTHLYEAGATQENSGISNDKRDLAAHPAPLRTEGRRSSTWHLNATYGRRWWHESGDRQHWRDFKRGEKRISPDANAS